MAIIQSGNFISDGTNQTINIPSDVDFINVYNFTQSGVTNNSGIQFYWQRGMPADTGIIIATQGASFITEQFALTSGGFTLFDDSVTIVGIPVATTSTTNAVRPVVATGSTAGLSVGSIIRLSHIAAVPNLCGIDFEIDTIVTNTSFRIRWPLANVPGAVGGAGFYRMISPAGDYVPQRFYIVDIDSVGATSVITTSVRHTMEIGNEVRVNVPSPANGMVEIDSMQGSVIAVDSVNNTFTLDIDSSSFTPFVYPAPAASPFTPASCYAFGENTPVALLNPPQDILADASGNVSILGITLAAGVNSPAGQASDQIFYVAGKSDADNLTIIA
jgi:hypothetical protein